jgi:hypothetical protein
MPDTAPGQVTNASGWPGSWQTVTREEYDALIEANGGYQALAVHSACTHRDGENYFLTAWGLRDQDYPLVQNELRGCDESLPPRDYGLCPGTHTFARFIYDPAQAEEED